jgi:hypothetical protein
MLSRSLSLSLFLALSPSLFLLPSLLSAPCMPQLVLLLFFSSSIYQI